MQSLSENLIYRTLVYIDIFFYFPINYCWVHRGGSRGRVQGVRTPSPEMTCGFLIQLVFCKKKVCGSGSAGSADNGCYKRDESHLMQPRTSHPSSFLGLLASVQTPPPLKKSGIERFFFSKGGGGCTQARAYWTWLLPAQCNGERCPLKNAS